MEHQVAKAVAEGEGLGPKTALSLSGAASFGEVPPRQVSL